MFKKIFFYWLPAIIWMVIIFYLSARQKVTVSEDSLINFLVFKGLHMIEYAGLCFWLFRAFTSIIRKATLSEKLTLALFLTILYSVSDEIHQTFIPTREGITRDVAIDSIGAFFMYIYIKNNLHFLKKLLWKSS